jgi:ribosomal protein S16
LKSNLYDGSISKNKFDVLFGDVYIVKEPNQIKHVENLGTWNPKTNNIYHLKNDVTFDENSEYFKPANIVSSFGQELS